MTVRFEFEGPHHLWDHVDGCYWIREKDAVATKTKLLSALIEARRFVRAYCGEQSVELEQIESVIKTAQ